MAVMNIAFRTDATIQIGTGHFMRCLTLADGLKKRGVHIRFVSRGLPMHLRDMLSAKGMELALLPNEIAEIQVGDLAHSHWLGASQAQDAQATMQALSDVFWDWLVVDHYALDASWEKALRARAKQIMVIDDIADRQHDCDLLLDQNFYADMHTRYADKVPAHCRLLLGPRYALLRDEFKKLHQQVKPRSGVVKNILVFFGGIDANNYTGLAINALSGLAIEGIQVNIVIGAQHPYKQQIEKACEQQEYVCHVQTTKMAELMANADLAIGAGGSATWERCCLGLPALSICVADNQRKQIADAAEIGLLISPSIESDLVGLINDQIQMLIKNPLLLKLISTNAMNAVDGMGVKSVTKVIFDLQINRDEDHRVLLRLATIEDANLVWPWRNHESTRRYFFDASPVSIQTHFEWWKQSLKNRNRVLLLASSKGIAFGVVRFDFDSINLATISIYLNPEYVGKGLGRSVIKKSLVWLHYQHPEIKSVRAEIIPENLASLRVFQAEGFREYYRVLIWKASHDSLK